MSAARFTVITPECVRLEYSPSGRFTDAPTLLALGRGSHACGGPEDFGPVPVVVEDGRGERVIDTGRMHVHFAPDGRPFHPGNLCVQILPGPAFEGTQWTPGERPRGNLGGALRTLDGVRRAVPLADGLLTTDGWYLLDDTSGHLAEDGWVRPRDAAPGETDWYLFGYGRDFRAALRALAAVSGPVPLPRKVMLGSWYSRYWPYTSKDYRDIVQEYDFHGFPLDVMVLDMDWHRAGWTGWSWNRDLLPDAEDLLAWLHARGVAVTLNLHPADGVHPHEDRYPAFMQALGRDPASRDVVPFDAGDRRYMQALCEEVLRPLEEPDGGPSRGVDFWWMDWQQDEFVRSLPGLTNLAWLNELFHRHTRDHGRRGAVFSRWGGWGDHRNPIHFSGDTHTGWDSLAFQVPFTSASSNSGCFFWSHDIGGHFGARDEECVARWTQFGALSAALRVHAARSRLLDRRPWAAGRAFERSMRRAYKLRSRLMPYIYTQVERCCADALPLIRPMYLEHPTEPAAYRSPQQYMLGDHLLVAPIVSPGVGPRRVAVQNVWFPPFNTAGTASAGSGGPSGGVGERWYDLFTAERYAAGSEAVVAADINEIPIYVRAGVPIPMQPATLRMGTEPLRRLSVRLFPAPPGGTGESELYEDDGDTQGYRRGECAVTPLIAAWTEGRVRLRIGPTTGAYPGQPPRRAVDVDLAGVGGAEGAWVDGESIAHGFEPDEPGIHIHIPERDIREAIDVEIAFRPADFRRIAERNRRRRLADALDRPVPESSLHAAVVRLAGTADVPGAPPLDMVMAVAAGIAVRADNGHFRLFDSLGVLDEGCAQVAVIDRVGREEALVHETVVAVPRRGSALIDEGPSPLPAPPAGLRATRALRVSFTSRGDPASFHTIIRRSVTPLRSWLVAGPFPFDWTRNVADQRHPPETDLSNAAPENGWTPGVPSAGWAVDVRESLRTYGGLAYAAAMIRSPHDQDATLEIESGDRMEAWVNGAKVFSVDTAESMDSARGSVPVRLRQGDNRILVKVTSGGGGWGFTLGVAGEAPVEEPAHPS